MPDHPRIIEFGYTNWIGQFAIRKVTPTRIYWGATKYHPQPQWLLEGYDHDKNSKRDFALQDCDFATRQDGDEVAF